MALRFNVGEVDPPGLRYNMVLYFQKDDVLDMIIKLAERLRVADQTWVSVPLAGSLDLKHSCPLVLICEEDTR